MSKSKNNKKRKVGVQLSAVMKLLGEEMYSSDDVFIRENVQNAIAKGYTFIIASSDLFVLNSWAENAEELVKKYSND